MTDHPNTEAIPSEEVEAAAEAMRNKSGYPLGSKQSPNLAYWRRITTAALTAAYPLHDERLRAELDLQLETARYYDTVIVENAQERLTAAEAELDHYREALERVAGLREGGPWTDIAIDAFATPTAELGDE